MTTSQPRFNPFPGLRPFEPEEDHLFFGREKEIDELLRRLRSARFLSVVGTSGSGKSSLVRCGLITALHGGLMVQARANWRVAVIRPGEDPIGNLAAALGHPDILGTDPQLATTAGVLLDATLRRSTGGLADAVRFARIPSDDNLLVVVDQFEELFRFRRNRRIDNSRDEAIAFVKLLLEAAGAEDLPIYIVLTMRSDFIGDCMEYPGLPEAVNSGQYLVPRMSRDSLRTAVTGPVAVGGGTITPRLVLRLLNDIGDDQNQLPVFQHVLMRTWDFWTQRGQTDQPIDIPDYENVGTLRNALSLHAEETFRETGSERARQIAERMFKALTDTFSDARGVRRPAAVSELAGICEAGEADVIDVIEVFRQPGRSFLMPPVTVPLTSRSIVDLSHESLMRCWDRLVAWAEEERTAAAFYVRLSQAAAWHAQGTGGLWDAPVLDLGLQWKQRTKPTEAWATRFGGSFTEAMAFLDRSAAERERVREAQEQSRRRQLRQAWTAAAVLGTLFLVAGSLAYLVWRENRRAEAETRRAETNLRLATAAVDDTLSSAQVDPERAGADVPQLGELRRKLLEKARDYSLRFLEQNPSTEKLRAEMALAHFRLGHISRSLDRADDAAEQYQRAIEQFGALDREKPSADYKQALANAYNWLGETYRPLPDRREAAAKAYESAFQLQASLVAANPGHTPYRQELARTLYNRGIVRAMSGTTDTEFRAAEKDFRDAIGLLAPLAAQDTGGMAAQELARAYNNLAVHIAADASRLGDAADLYDRAIELDERLLAAEPDNQQYSLELAQFTNNSADVLRKLSRFAQARDRNQRVLGLLSEPPRPPPLLAIELADTHQLRGRILEAENDRSTGIVPAYEESLRRFQVAARDPAALGLQHFHLRFGDLLVSIADRTGNNVDAERARRLLMHAVDWYVALANSGPSGPPRYADTILDNLSLMVPEFGEAEQRVILKQYPQLQNRATRPK